MDLRNLFRFKKSKSSTPPPPTLSGNHSPDAHHQRFFGTIALQGYDLVSYCGGQPVKGSEAYAVLHNGVAYLFSTPETRDSFQASPDRYLPQYGGWCAFAMGDTGKKVDVNPLRYQLKEGKLFFFYTSLVTDTLLLWEAREEELHPKADDNWAKMVGS